MATSSPKDVSSVEQAQLDAYPSALHLIRILAGCQSLGQVTARTKLARSAVRMWENGERSPLLHYLHVYLRRLGGFTLFDLDRLRDLLEVSDPSPLLWTAAQQVAEKGIGAIAKHQAQEAVTPRLRRPRGPQPPATPPAESLRPSDWLTLCYERVRSPQSSA